MSMLPTALELQTTSPSAPSQEGQPQPIVVQPQQAQPVMMQQQPQQQQQVIQMQAFPQQMAMQGQMQPVQPMYVMTNQGPAQVLGPVYSMPQGGQQQNVNYIPTQVMAPQRQVMGDDVMNQPGLLIRQKNSECCRCFCCQPNMEWRLHDFKENVLTGEVRQLPTRMTGFEDASCCGRTWSCCMPGCRASTTRIYMGDVDNPANLQPVMTHSKDCTCGVNCLVFVGENGEAVRVPCCCNLPYLQTKDAQGNLLGTSQYLCTWCVPHFSIENARGERVWHMEPDTCCCGCCPVCQCGGKGARCFAIPWYLRNPITNEHHDDGKIMDLWAGLAKECCTKQNMYQIKFPNTTDPAMKAVLIGAALLLDMAIFEQAQNQ